MSVRIVLLTGEIYDIIIYKSVRFEAWLATKKKKKNVVNAQVCAFLKGFT